MIVDTHAHYIEAPSIDRPHRTDGVSIHSLSVDDLARQAADAGVDKVVQVTASAMGYDNRYSFEGAEQRPDRILGVIGRFDPLAPEMERRLEEFFAHPRALGIRFTLFQGWNEAWLRDRVLDPFFRVAAGIGVPICLFAPFRYAEMLETVERHPDVRFIIDHMGVRHNAQHKEADPFANWAALLELAARSNAWVKVSHFPEAVWVFESWPFPTAQRRFQELCERVGADRLIWGSNFPPVERACTYRQALDFVRTECSFLSSAEREAILGGNFLREFGRGLA